MLDASTANQYLSLDEAARNLGVHRLTIRRAISDGQLPAVRVRRRVLIPKQDFNIWISNCRIARAAGA